MSPFYYNNRKLLSLLHILPPPSFPPRVDAMSVCCRKYEARSAAAVPPRVLQAAATPLSSLCSDPKWLVREQIPHRNRVPKDVGMGMSYRQTDCRKRVLWNTGQLMITNAQGAECTLFLLFSCFLFLFCFAESLALVKDVWIKQRERQGCSVQCRDTHWYV